MYQLNVTEGDCVLNTLKDPVYVYGGELKLLNPTVSTGQSEQALVSSTFSNYYGEKVYITPCLSINIIILVFIRDTC